MAVLFDEPSFAGSPTPSQVSPVATADHLYNFNTVEKECKPFFHLTPLPFLEKSNR
jgi:hypothetical protein